MNPNAPLHVIDLHKPSMPTDHPRASISDTAISCLRPCDWLGRWAGRIDPDWHLELGDPSKFWVPQCGLPGTAYGPIDTHSRSKRVGVSFKVSHVRQDGSIVPCVGGCLVMAKLGDQVWQDVLDTLRDWTEKLPGLHPWPHEPPDMPGALPFIMLVWLKASCELSDATKAALRGIVPVIGWGAVEGLRRQP